MNFREAIQQLVWNNQQYVNRVTKFLELYKSPKLLPEEQRLDGHIFMVSILPQTSEISDRFSKLADSASEQKVLELSKQYAHPYTIAVILDYRYELLEEGKAKKEAADEVIKQYIKAVEYFSQQHSVTNYWMACYDSINRARKVSTKYGNSIDIIIKALILYINKLESNDLFVLQQMMDAIIPGIKKQYVNERNITDLYQIVDKYIAKSQGDIVSLMRTIAHLAKLANVTEYTKRIVGLQAQVASHLAASENFLFVAGYLQETLKRARDIGETCLLAPLQKIMENVDPLAKEMMQQIEINGKMDTTIIDETINLLKQCEPIESLVLFASQEWPIPEAPTFQPSIVTEICSVVAIGEHGPSGKSTEDVQKHQNLEFFLHRSAAILRKIYESGLPCFSVDFLLQTLLTYKILREDQKDIMYEGLDAWYHKKFTIATFILLPMTEYIVSTICSLASKHSKTMFTRNQSIGTKHGNTVTEMVKDIFGDDFERLYAFLVSEEDSPKVKCSHGYMKDRLISNRDADYCIYIIFALLYQVTQKENATGNDSSDPNSVAIDKTTALPTCIVYKK